ncbi:hypothetical protein CKAH01_06950 [Colletotrichum kahawae]|uniref:Uncharacterized protein n=1 Tax=Colletotrichum kahawae TaxID=34407 RepID=A0AAE0D2M6_COLKA|nr:hypothetical protein CKAH01_06950 [Colletotrichum kahawae]
MEDADRLQHHCANFLSTGPAARIGGGPEMEGEPDTDGRDEESFGSVLGDGKALPWPSHHIIHPSNPLHRDPDESSNSPTVGRYTRGTRLIRETTMFLEIPYWTSAYTVWGSSRVRASLSPGSKDANAIMGAAAAAESSMSEAHAMHGVWGHKHTTSRNRYLESAKHIGRKMKSSWRHPWTGSNAMLSSGSALGLPAKYLCLAVQHL